MPDNVEVSKTGLLMGVFIGLMFTIIIALIGLLGVHHKTGCWGECDPVCAAQQCATGIELNPAHHEGGQHIYHEIPEPGTMALIAFGLPYLYQKIIRATPS